MPNNPNNTSFKTEREQNNKSYLMQANHSPWSAGGSASERRRALSCIAGTSP
jgi:hypothetical protein